jgi:hypothetical protein
MVSIDDQSFSLSSLTPNSRASHLSQGKLIFVLNAFAVRGTRYMHRAESSVISHSRSPLSEQDDKAQFVKFTSS